METPGDPRTQPQGMRTVRAWLHISAPVAAQTTGALLLALSACIALSTAFLFLAGWMTADWDNKPFTWTWSDTAWLTGGLVASSAMAATGYLLIKWSNDEAMTRGRKALLAVGAIVSSVMLVVGGVAWSGYSTDYQEPYDFEEPQVGRDNRPAN